MGRISDEQLEVMSTDKMKVLAISVDQHDKSNIELVEVKAEAGYLAAHADPQFIRELPKIYIPNMPRGHYRGFEISGDSMLPMESGSIVICRYIEKLADIKDDRTYIIISKSEGVVYKRVNVDKENRSLILSSDNPLYMPYKIAFSEVAEVWQYHAHIAFSDSKKTFNSMLEDKLVDMQKKLNDIHGKVMS